MRIGVDLDGTITRFGSWNLKIQVPWWFGLFLVPLTMVTKKEAVKKLREIKILGGEIIIITARPKILRKITERMLRWAHVPFDNLFCVGHDRNNLAARKLGIIKQESVELFVDDNKETIVFLKSNFIKASISFDFDS